MLENKLGRYDAASVTYLFEDNTDVTIPMISSKDIPPDMEILAAQTYLTMKKERALSGVNFIDTGKPVDIEFNNMTVSLLGPEEGSWMVKRADLFGSVYIYDADSKLIMEIHTNSNQNKAVVIDHEVHESYVLDQNGSPIASAKWVGNPNRIVEAKLTDMSHVFYKYDGLMYDAEIKSEAGSAANSYVLDLQDEEGSITARTIIVPLPYFVALDDMIVFTPECQIYRSDRYDYDNYGHIVGMEEYVGVMDADFASALFTKYYKMLQDEERKK